MRNTKSNNLLLVTLILFIMPLSINAKEVLTIVGTGSGMSILESIGKAFSEKYPNIIIEVPKSIGSGGGIKAVGEDKYILGRIARDIKENENRYGLTKIEFAKMPIAFFTNKSVNATSLTAKDLCGIYEGSIRTWDQLKCGKGKIRVIRREDGDSSLEVLLKSLSGFRDIIITGRSKTTLTDPNTVTEVSVTENSIAFGTWPNIKTNSDVKVISLNNIHPTNKEYPCTGTLSLICKEKNIKGIVDKFIKFLSTNEARKAIIKAGGLPVL